jgi:hypothetical protein
MELPMTAGLAVLCLILAIFCGWRGAQPADPIKGVRMVPWRALMLLSAAFEIVLVVRLADQLGLMPR